ncbi:DUF2723 domain-containing protein [bacterium]|nr:DUF2723 domain-containing protein [bacterium]
MGADGDSKLGRWGVLLGESLLLVLVAVVLLLQTRDTSHWRDAAEFVLAGVYLDVAHPPGFATYAVFSNLATFFPFGPLTWRIHLFSVGVTVLSFFLAYQIFLLLHPQQGGESSEQPSKKSSMKRGVTLFAFCFGALPLFFSPAFLRQATTAEAYQLNALFVLLLLLCALFFERTRDFRFIYGAAFCFGLGLGNHPALLFIGVPCFFLYLPTLGISRATFSVFFGMLGFAIIVAIPIRAQSAPPLNTGEAVTFERFVRLVTDARDRHLRPDTLHAVGGLSEKTVKRQISLSQEDAQKILDETGWFLAPLSVIALLSVLVFVSWRAALLFFVSLGGTLFFFRGWQPDPFIPVFFIFSVLGGFSLSLLFSRSSLVSRVFLSCALLFLSLPVALRNFPELKSQRGHELPAQTTEQLLTSLPYHAVFVTESSWYLARYLQRVEGVRTDLVLGYTPQLLFPDYFRPARYLIEGVPYDSSHPSIRGLSDIREPSIGAYVEFLNRTSQEISVFVEPTLVTNSVLARASALTEAGVLRVGPPALEQGFPEGVLTLGEEIQQLPPSFLRKDAAHLLETRALPLADILFLQNGNGFQSIYGIRKVCGHPRTRICSYETHLKTVQYALQDGNLRQARFLLDELRETRREKPIGRKVRQILRSQEIAQRENASLD